MEFPDAEFCPVIDKKNCQWQKQAMLDVEVIENPEAAAIALDPVRGKLLAELSAPMSAAALAQKIGMPRQKVNYHLRALEAHGLLTVTEERKWGGLTERLLKATAESYVVSPGALGRLSVKPSRTPDRLSASYVIALGARIVREVAGLWRQARTAEKRLATLAIDTEIRFRSAAERAAFTRELTEAITGLAARYHDEAAPGGRSHRVVLVAHPMPAEDAGKEQSCH